MGITNDGTNLYVADFDNNTIRKIVISSGVVTTLAGTAGSTGSTDGIGSTARFYNPMGITNDGSNLYVADTSNYTIRKIVISSGVVTTLAGTARSYGSTDGIGTTAEFYYPMGITSDGINLYIADTFNHTIRKIFISTGEVITLAGTAGHSGYLDDSLTSATFHFPLGIDYVDGSLFITEPNNDIRKIE